ncbi:MAG: Holliday junction resolvase RuvX [bacterium]|nr:Holliday junction resolvase RuvX [bacterium]
MKYLGIDYGTKRVGVAFSDDGGTLAFPKEIIKNGQDLMKNLGAIIKEENINEIVVGESMDLNNLENKIQKEIKVFVKKMEEDFKLKVHMQKEFMTTIEARGREGKEKNDARKTKIIQNKEIDASAAALILQRYLDKINN